MQLKPPCYADPVSYDLDRGIGTPHPPVEQLIQLCRTQCAFLDWCRSRYAARDDVFGVVAGEYRPWPQDSAVATLHRSTVLRRIVAAIRDELDDLAPGEALPSCSQLAREFGTSRVTVRAALRWLVDQDVLTPPATRADWYRVPPRKEQAA